MMRTWSFYDPATGLFTGRTFSGPSDALAANSRGASAIEGEHDPHRQRVVDGEVVDYVPPAPSPEHLWDSTAKRWELPLAVRQAAAADRQARTLIASAEAGTFRALREALLAPSVAAILEREAPEALAALRSADTDITAKRGALTKRGEPGGRG